MDCELKGIFVRPRGRTKKTWREVWKKIVGWGLNN